MGLHEIRFIIRDAKNKFSAMTIYATSDDECDGDGRGDPAQFAQDYAVLLDDMIDGQIVNIRTSQLVELPVGIKATPVATADVEEGALFIWGTEINTYKKQRIPTFSESLIVAGSSAVDLEALPSDWLLINQEPIELAADWIIAPTDERGADITVLKSAREDFKKSRKSP